MMLYNRKWDAKTKPDIYALSTLIAWLEKRPAEEEYQYWNCNGLCLLGQYMADHGKPWGSDVYLKLSDRASPSVTWGDSWGHLASAYPHTFGGALERARESQALAEEA